MEGSYCARLASSRHSDRSKRARIDNGDVCEQRKIAAVERQQMIDPVSLQHRDESGVVHALAGDRNCFHRADLIRRFIDASDFRRQIHFIFLTEGNEVN